MPKDILQALPELVKAEIITPETAKKIRNYYGQQTGKTGQGLLIVFSMLGALLIGLGLILILAHNWDELSRATKTSLAFLPLVLGQGLAFYVLLRKPGQEAWQESVATFLFLAIGASISLVSQIYHITSDLGAFLLTWVLLGLPLMYLLDSSMVSLLYLLGATCYVVESQDMLSTFSPAVTYLLLLLAGGPQYYRLLKAKPAYNFTLLHHWLLPLSIALALLHIGQGNGAFRILAYLSLFNLYCSVGLSEYFIRQKFWHNGYVVIGMLGTGGLLLALSFVFFWEELPRQHYTWASLTAPQCVAAALLLFLAAGTLGFRYQRQAWSTYLPLALTLLFSVLAFALAFLWPVLATILINLLVLFLGLAITRLGISWGHLGLLNFGLLLIAALISCRFFDTNLSFVIRGLLFVLVGTGFFLANYRLLQKRKGYEK